MNLGHLRAFVTVAEERSFRRAAGRLYVAASPLSRRIKELERELDVTLFARDTRSVQLTPEGKALLPLAREVVQKVDAFPAALRRIAQDSHPLRIGIVSDVPPSLRDRVLARLRRAATLQAIEVETVPPRQLESRLLKRELDLGIMQTPLVHWESLDTQELLVEQMAEVAVSAGSPLARRERLTIADLGGLSMAVPRGVTGPAPQTAAIMHAASEAGVKRFTFVPEHDATALLTLTAVGNAFALLAEDPNGPVRRLFDADPGVAIRPIGDLCCTAVTVAAWSREGHEDSALVRTAATIMRSTPAAAPAREPLAAGAL
jgi:DNA-binding transcriptional LysR family regulator